MAFLKRAARSFHIAPLPDVSFCPKLKSLLEFVRGFAVVRIYSNRETAP